MNPRLPKHESLERRQLLAGDFLSGEFATNAGASVVSVPVALTAGADATHASQELFGNPFAFAQPDSASDWVEEDGDQLVAIRLNVAAFYRPGLNAPVPAANAPLATAFVFQRNDAGELESTGSIDLNFRPDRVLWTDQMLLIIGSKEITPATLPENPETLVMSVDRDQLLDRTVTILTGPYVSSVIDGDRLAITTANLVSLGDLDSGQTVTYPETPYSVHLFDLSEDSLEVIARGGIGGPVVENAIVDDQLLILERTPTLTGDNSDYRELVRYRVEDDLVVRDDSVVINASAKTSIHFDQDGQTAVTVSVVDHAVDQNASGTRRLIVNLIDTTQDALSVFESLNVDLQSTMVDYDVNPSAVVIASGANEVYVVDTDQSIDINSASRVQRVQLRSNVQSFSSSGLAVESISGHLFAVARRDDPANNNGGISQPGQTKVSLISVIENGEVSEVTLESDAAAIFLDGQAEPTLLQWTDFSIETRTHFFSVIEVRSSQQMTESARVAVIGANELDVNDERLVVLQLDQMKEFRWDALTSPTTYPIGQPFAAPHAVDDIITQNVDWQFPYLNVLSNDVFETPTWIAPVQITELINAPAGVSLNDQGQLRLSGELLESEGEFSFSYVVQQARSESTASVTLNLVQFDDQEIAAVRNDVLRHAAEDLEIDPTQLSLGRVVAYTEVMMPEVMENGVANELGGRFGVIVELNVDGELLRYAADFDGNIVRLDTRQIETMMELSMRVVDRNGDLIEQLQTGDEFFIEVSAKDTRQFGAGVFGVAFDLPLPAANLELTGEIEALGDWDPIGDDSPLTSIDEFQAIEVLIEHPGNAAQPIVRFGVRAVAGGEVRLQLDPAESFHAELLLRGRNDVVSPFEVDFGSLTLSVAGVLPTDTDANGAVTPLDALRVINFLALYGSVSTNELHPLVRDDAESEAAIRLTAMQRLDTNADGLISARDALAVIIEIGRQFSSNPSEGEAVAASELQSSLDDEDDTDDLTAGFQSALF
ncbi:dockerin type I domain-containing protein [Roseiconus lacunae]|uniref:Dockerin type I domain-containing protein n=1 Tax=Roseiconus lacunae TaxID=2605694 RepID=A0ABT7PKX6_9BACT|nr:dockerin type I domain-containing protein [Roseiconus lacunae]MDM4016946.1 dockerin type I domain-containing protein [Roseiconus lacunae]